MIFPWRPKRILYSDLDSSADKCGIHSISSESDSIVLRPAILSEGGGGNALSG